MDLSDAWSRGLKNAQRALNETKRMSILKPNFYSRIDNNANVDSILAEEQEAIISRYVDMVNACRFVYALSKSPSKQAPDTSLKVVLEKSGVSAKQFNAALSGVIPGIISKESAKEAINRLNLEKEKSNLTDSGRKAIEKQIELILQFVKKGSIDVNDRALSQKEIEGALQQ